MLENVSIFTHSSIQITAADGTKIHFDPFGITDELNDADYIFITHSHYDHFSPEDILKVKKENSKIVVTSDLSQKAKDLGFKEENVQIALPNTHYILGAIEFDTIPAYNQTKQFHPLKNGWIGYIVNIDNVKYYIAGDTDYTSEAASVKCDVAMLPIGGTYTMNPHEAAKLANAIHPKYVVPTHYGSIVGTPEDADIFISLVDKDINCVKLIHF